MTELYEIYYINCKSSDPILPPPGRTADDSPLRYETVIEEYLKFGFSLHVPNPLNFILLFNPLKSFKSIPTASEI